MYLLVAQVIIAVTLIVLVVLQAKGAGLSGVLGGSTNYHAKRGVEKSLFYTTILVSILFVGLAITGSI
jgi:protein translocase SecG subunit